MAYMKKEMFSEALADATKTVFLAPNWAKVNLAIVPGVNNYKGYQRKGAALFALGKTSEAKFAYQKGITLAPLDQQLRAGLAQVMEQEQGKDELFQVAYILGNFLREQQEKLEQQKKEEEERYNDFPLLLRPTIVESRKRKKRDN